MLKIKPRSRIPSVSQFLDPGAQVGRESKDEVGQHRPLLGRPEQRSDVASGVGLVLRLEWDVRHGVPPSEKIVHLRYIFNVPVARKKEGGEKGGKRGKKD